MANNNRSHMKGEEQSDKEKYTKQCPEKLKLREYVSDRKSI